MSSKMGKERRKHILFMLLGETDMHPRTHTHRHTTCAPEALKSFMKTKIFFNMGNEMMTLALPPENTL